MFLGGFEKPLFKVISPEAGTTQLQIKNFGFTAVYLRLSPCFSFTWLLRLPDVQWLGRSSPSIFAIEVSPYI
jgi:hypothetical protein